MKKLVLSLALVGAFGFASAQEAPKEHGCHRPEQRKMGKGKEGRGKNQKNSIFPKNKQNNWKNFVKSTEQKRKNFMRSISENSKES